MHLYSQTRAWLAFFKARFQMFGGRFTMLSTLFAWLLRIKNTVEDVLAAFPQSGPALATLLATGLAYFGFHVSAGKLEAVAAIVAALIAALTAHSVRKAAARKAAVKK